MKIAKFYLLMFSGLIIFLVTTAYFYKDASVKYRLGKVFSAAQDDNSKIIKFNHKIHIADAGIKCEDCHTAAGKSTSLKDNLNPKKEVCATCHDVKDKKDCSLCHYDGVFAKLKPAKSELIFSHKYHIETEKKKCADCHQGIEAVKFAKESAAGMPSMESCVTCHDNKKAANDCEACHSNLTNLHPVTHRSPNFLNEHKINTTMESGKNNCMMCHSDNFCQACHSPSKFKGTNTKDNFYAPYYTKEGAVRTDRTALQKLTNAHDLNYKFTHGLDANQKSFECKTCHSEQTFCANCHQNGGELISGIAPTSHQIANFTTFGVNTGGGKHSELAKRDIDACSSCHNTEGRDPVCIRCHYDNDGVKGTNAKTHEYGFMKDEKGIWHNTQGAVCYTCHTDANAKPNGIAGVGFCGYCHGQKTR
ncbi:MAG: cytochrome C [Ignavibacteria bacterium]|nr:cytochrome C [Ignavibacteria bacterium]